MKDHQLNNEPGGEIKDKTSQSSNCYPKRAKLKLQGVGSVVFAAAASKTSNMLQPSSNNIIIAMFPTFLIKSIYCIDESAPNKTFFHNFYLFFSLKCLCKMQLNAHNLKNICLNSSLMCCSTVYLGNVTSIFVT